ncbi:MAG: hypothetical protein ABIL09_14990 [Gemmatimonadota bacterium]
MSHTAFHVRTRFRMYFLVVLACAASALLIQFAVSSTTELRHFADQQISSAVQKAVHAEVTQAVKAGDSH